MPPKVQSNASGKGQTSLFSFFQKPKVVEQPAAPAADATSSESEQQKEVRQSNRVSYYRPVNIS